MAKRSGGYRAPKNYQPKPKAKRAERPAEATGDYRDRAAAARRKGVSPRRGPASEKGAGEVRGRRGEQDARGQRDARDPRRDDGPASGASRSGRSERTEGRGTGVHRNSTAGPRTPAGPRKSAQTRRNAPEQLPRKKRGGAAPVDDAVLARFTAKQITAAEAEGVTFADLGLDDRIVAALGELGAHEPFPIQVATIPDILGGRNVLGRGRTGSGKTIAFGAALVQRLLTMRSSGRKAIGRAPKALILANTRELALQIDRTVQPIARAVGLYTTQLYGGVPYAKQQTALKRGVDIVIGTPGRIEDLARSGALDLTQIAITVLDEADEMSSLGFLEPVERILAQTRDNGQRLLFSATLDAAVVRIVEQFLPKPAVHEVAGEEARGDIDHRVLVVDRYDKEAVVAQLAGSGGRVLVFTRTRANAEHYAAVLADYGVPAVALHGDLTQARRARNLAELTRGKVNVLVATDVAARGIHIDDVRLVVQADPPDEYKTYLHRSGRTGRAGHRGTVVTVIAPSRRTKMLDLLERAEIKAALVPASPGGRELDEFTR